MNINELIELLKDLKPEYDFTPDTKIVEQKIFDSMGMISLVAEISDEFDVDISPMDIVPENFETVQTLFDLIVRLADED